MILKTVISCRELGSLIRMGKKKQRKEKAALSVLLRIYEYLDCNIRDICDAVKQDV